MAAAAAAAAAVKEEKKSKHTIRLVRPLPKPVAAAAAAAPAPAKPLSMMMKRVVHTAGELRGIAPDAAAMAMVLEMFKAKPKDRKALQAEEKKRRAASGKELRDDPLAWCPLFFQAAPAQIGNLSLRDSKDPRLDVEDSSAKVKDVKLDASSSSSDDDDDDAEADAEMAVAKKIDPAQAARYAMKWCNPLTPHLRKLTRRSEDDAEHKREFSDWCNGEFRELDLFLKHFVKKVLEADAGKSGRPGLISSELSVVESKVYQASIYVKKLVEAKRLAKPKDADADEWIPPELNPDYVTDFVEDHRLTAGLVQLWLHKQAGKWPDADLTPEQRKAALRDNIDADLQSLSDATGEPVDRRLFLGDNNKGEPFQGANAHLTAQERSVLATAALLQSALRGALACIESYRLQDRPARPLYDEEKDRLLLVLHDVKNDTNDQRPPATEDEVKYCWKVARTMFGLLKQLTGFPQDDILGAKHKGTRFQDIAAEPFHAVSVAVRAVEKLVDYYGIPADLAARLDESDVDEDVPATHEAAFATFSAKATATLDKMWKAILIRKHPDEEEDDGADVSEILPPNGAWLHKVHQIWAFRVTALHSLVDARRNCCAILNRCSSPGDVIVANGAGAGASALAEDLSGTADAAILTLWLAKLEERIGKVGFAPAFPGHEGELHLRLANLAQFIMELIPEDHLEHRDHLPKADGSFSFDGITLSNRRCLRAILSRTFADDFAIEFLRAIRFIPMHAWHATQCFDDETDGKAGLAPCRFAEKWDEIEAAEFDEEADEAADDIVKRRKERAAAQKKARQAKRDYDEMAKGIADPEAPTRPAKRAKPAAEEDDIDRAAAMSVA